MNNMKIIEQPDIFLREPTSEVKLPLSSENEVLLNKMINTMYLNKGIGLAANQIGYPKRMFVMDTSTDHNSPKIFINPIIEKRADEKLTQEEGCLSCPNKFANVRRPIYIGLKWICRHGKEQYKTFYGLPARVVQHEMDHLEGKLCID